MDVVLTPVGPDGTRWSLTNRLRRPLGTVEKGDDFTIVPELAGGLISIEKHHPTLDAAMTAIARHLGGTCSLDSQDWD